MLNFYAKTFFSKKHTLSPELLAEDEEVETNGKKLQKKIKKMFQGSLAIREVDAGSTNACEQELTALTNPFYDIERFGIHFVASPRHADMLFATGPVTRNMKDALVKTYHAMPEPKIVVAVGDAAIDGGIFKDSYAVIGGISSVIPVDYTIPGDPPTPGRIISSLLAILEIIDGKPSDTQSAGRCP